MKLSYFPDNVIEQYKLKNKVDSKDFVYLCQDCKGNVWFATHGHHCAKLLEERLNKYGYYQSKYTPGFWKHESRPICFSLVVDDFGVKYACKEDAQHLMDALQEARYLTPRDVLDTFRREKGKPVHVF